ncbi:TonB-dependent receptor [Flaviaesturariibacter amylovorans]|uniref:TonB-dependent receptor n=2 Tax=Flaviaesturariibacter amylovorans TaxID=1084520 RepID=A0ABP8HSF2_9BACT
MLGAFLLLHAAAQGQELSGTVRNAQGPLPGATVSYQGNGPARTVLSDSAGRYTILAAPGTGRLRVSYSGLEAHSQPVTLKAGSRSVVNVNLEPSGALLNDVVVVGSRTGARSLSNTPLPVDILSGRELQATGQTTFDKALQYKVPSFNTIQSPVSDATSLLDPYEIRNLGPSRTLVLINGKRKNASSLVYTWPSMGRGETGADLSAIPIDAVQRIEILRDGASAQYGSDAIAGVVNVILKDRADEGYFTLRGGVTSRGDGSFFGIAANNGSRLGKKGFINYTLDLEKTNVAARPGTVDAEGEALDFSAPIAEVRAFLDRHPDALNLNGTPETAAARFLVNGGAELAEGQELYFNAAYVYKKVSSFANYRAPYWRTTDYGLLTPAGQPYNGYLPGFGGDLNDYNATLGFRSERGRWNTDISITTGGNSQQYWVNSVNHSLGRNSPVHFRNGGFGFNHLVGNLNITRSFNDRFRLAFGTEFRSENFSIIAGDTASYSGSGSDCFPGISADNALQVNRFNFGGYVDASYDITPRLVVDAALRLESYSDFGDAFVWKGSARYKVLDNRLVARASASTGFRAPSLHQIYVQKTQYSFVAGQGVVVDGLVNNVSRQAKLLGIPSLGAEKSMNFTAGLTARPTPRLSITLDYYDITVRDRIVLSNSIKPSGDPQAVLDQILEQNNISTLYFFANAFDSRTSGIDLVASYRALPLAGGRLALNAAGNYTFRNERSGAVNNPAVIESAGQSVVNGTQEALMLTSRPKYKAVLGGEWERGRFAVTLNNTLFGPATFRNEGLDENLEVRFRTKVVTDLGVQYKTKGNVTFSANVSNVLNVLPEWELHARNGAGAAVLKDPALVKRNVNLITFNGRYAQMTYYAGHFSQLGTIFNLQVRVGL